MNIKITADSTCDLSKELMEENNIEILPLYVVKDGASYRDGLEITPQDIFDFVAPIAFPGFLLSMTQSSISTSAPNFPAVIKMHVWRRGSFPTFIRWIPAIFPLAAAMW